MDFFGDDVGFDEDLGNDNFNSWLNSQPLTSQLGGPAMPSEPVAGPAPQRPAESTSPCSTSQWPSQSSRAPTPSINPQMTPRMNPQMTPQMNSQMNPQSPMPGQQQFSRIPPRPPSQRGPSWAQIPNATQVMPPNATPNLPQAHGMPPMPQNRPPQMQLPGQPSLPQSMPQGLPPGMNQGMNQRMQGMQPGIQPGMPRGMAGMQPGMQQPGITSQMRAQQMHMELPDRQRRVPPTRKPASPANSSAAVSAAAAAAAAPHRPGSTQQRPTNWPPAGYAPSNTAADARSPSHPNQGTPNQGMPNQGMPGIQELPNQGLPPHARPQKRPRDESLLHAYQLSSSDVRYALGALSLYTQNVKMGTQVSNIRQIVRRVNMFSDTDCRNIVKRFELSMHDETCETAKLPVTRLLPHVFWGILSEVYAHLGRPPVAEFKMLANRKVSVLQLFQTVQHAGGYLSASLWGRWGHILRMLGIAATEDSTNIILDLIALYADTLLPFEIYACRNEHIRRALVAKLAPPRAPPAGRPGPMVSAEEQGTPLQGPQRRAGSGDPQGPQAPGAPMQGPPVGPMHRTMSHPGPQGYPQGPQHHPQGPHGPQGHPQGPQGPQLQNPQLQAPQGPQGGAPSGHVGPIPAGPNMARRFVNPDDPEPKRRSHAPSSSTLPFAPMVQDGHYVPQKRHSSTYGGRNVRYLSHLGNEIENWRPDVAFPLDLGTVDLHAVILSLASRDPAEVRQALDKLAVVSANPLVHESLQHCPRLFANLCDHIMLMLHHVLTPDEEGKPPGSQYVSKGLPTRPVDLNDSLAEVIAKRSGALKPMYDVLDRVKRESQPGTEIEIEVDEEGNELSRTERIATFDRPSGTDNTCGPGAGCNPNEKTANDPWPTDTLQYECGDGPFFHPCYGTRYERVESEIHSMEPVMDERRHALFTSLCDRLLLATCVLRNLSFSVANRPVIAHKPEFQALFWQLLDILGEHPKLLDSELRTLDLYKDVLTVLGNIALYLRLPNPRDTLKLVLFLISFSPVESPYTKEGELKLMDYDIDVHRYLPNAIDVFVKIAPREEPNRKLMEEVLLGTCQDPEYTKLLNRWLKAQGRSEAYPAELLTRMFALSAVMMPLTHFRPPSRDIETRQPYLLQGTLAAELLVNMIPATPLKSGLNIATCWLNSLEHFGARLVRTLNFMGMVVVSHGDGETQRPFARITQRGVNVVQQLFKKAKSDPNFSNTGIVPTIEHLLGGLMAAKMDKSVVKHLSSLYDDVANTSSKPVQ